MRDGGGGSKRKAVARTGAVVGHELVVGSALLNLAVSQDADRRRVSDCAEAVGDEADGAVFGLDQCVERALDESLALRVQRRRGLVEEDCPQQRWTVRLGNSSQTKPIVAALTDPWHSQHHPRDGDPLALTARQPHPLLPDPRLEAVLKLLDKLPRVCLLGRDSEVFFGVRILLQPVWAQHGS